MNEKEIRLVIDDVRHFNRYCLYEESLEKINEVILPIKNKDLEHEILKLKSFIYRKLQEPDIALIYINQALQCVKRNNIVDKKMKYAVCLMNKGIIYDEQKKYEQAIREYLVAVDIFRNDFKKTNDEGKLINSLVNLGTAYFQNQQYNLAKNLFKETMAYFKEDKNTDTRYIYIENMLHEIEQNEHF